MADDDHFSIKEHITSMDARMSKRLDEILDQAKRTNGRVQELERWRAYLMGIGALAIALGIPNLVKMMTS